MTPPSRRFRLPGAGGTSQPGSGRQAGPGQQAGTAHAAGPNQQTWSGPMESVSAATRTLGVLAELFEHTTDAILILDAEEIVIEANPRAELLLGAKSGELVGVSLVDMVPVGSTLLAFLNTSKDDQPLRLEVELGRRDGGYVPVEMVARRLSDGGTLLLCRDTTLDRTAVRVLERTERRFMALVKNSSDIIVVLDGHGGISYVSPAGAKLGLDSAYLSESDLWRLVHPRERTRLGTTMRELL